jgi:hypothetical protein
MNSPGASTVAQYFDPRLLSFLERVFKQEAMITNELGIYDRYAASDLKQEETRASLQDLVVFMEGLHSIIEDLQSVSCSLQISKRPFLDALGDVLSVSQNVCSLQEVNSAVACMREFFYFSPRPRQPGEVTARVAIHILPPYVDHVLRVARALAAGISKLHSLKVCGPGAVSRTDHVVVYLYSPEDLGLVLRLLDEGHTSDCIGGVVPPVMKELRPGVAFAEEPPNVPKSYVTNDGVTTKNPGKYDPAVNPFGFTEDRIALANKQRMSFGEFHTNRIWAALVKWRSLPLTGRTLQTFLLEVYEAYRRKGVDPRTPHLFPDREEAETKWFANYTFKNRL